NYPKMVKTAIEKSLPLLQTGADTFSKRSACVSCHNQALPAMTIEIARERGFTVDEKIAHEQSEAVYKPLKMGTPFMHQALTNPVVEKQVDKMLIDPSIGLVYLLSGLSADRWKPDATTQAAA